MQPKSHKKLSGEKILLCVADGDGKPLAGNNDGGNQKYVILFPVSKFRKNGCLAQSSAEKIAYQGECVNEKENPRSGSGHGSCLVDAYLYACLCRGYVGCATGRIPEPLQNGEF